MTHLRLVKDEDKIVKSAKTTTYIQFYVILTGIILISTLNYFTEYMTLGLDMLGYMGIFVFSMYADYHWGKEQCCVTKRLEGSKQAWPSSMGKGCRCGWC